MGIIDRIKSLFKAKKIESNEKKEEKTLFENPLEIPISTENFIEITDINGSISYEVEKISKYKRSISGRSFDFTDYVFSNEDNILRVVPTNEKNDFEYLFMKKMWEGEFSEEILDAVKCSEFYKNSEDGSCVTYFALNASKNGFKCYIDEMNMKESFHNDYELTYWDFYRDQKAELNEYGSESIILIVSIDGDSGFIKMYEGTKILKNNITVYKKES